MSQAGNYQLQYNRIYMQEGDVPLDRKLIGGKGLGLQQMKSWAIPVPPVITATTEVCRYYAEKSEYPHGFFERDIPEGIRYLEKEMAKEDEMAKKPKRQQGFGDPEKPLLLSVRSGAAVSMPGMMDTVLNVGINDDTVAGLAQRIGDRAAWDCYRRFCQMFGDVVLGVEREKFEAITNAVKYERALKEDLVKLREFENVEQIDLTIDVMEDRIKNATTGEDAALLSDNDIRKMRDIIPDAKLGVDEQERIVAESKRVIERELVELPQRLEKAEKEFRSIRASGNVAAVIEADEKLALLRFINDVVQQKGTTELPQDPLTQLEMAIHRVYGSWNNPRAIAYRQQKGLTGLLGTAVNIQAMVFGNSGDDSGTGVVFSRDPDTGEKGLVGNFLRNAQGEDVVAGIRTPDKIAQLAVDKEDLYDKIVQHCATLEAQESDMQDVEFTVENGCLYLLQTRDGQRQPAAGVKIAHDLVVEGRISIDTALQRLEANDVPKAILPTIEPEDRKKHEPIAKGVAASAGAACGKVAFSSRKAEELAATGEHVILTRTETSPDDIRGMHVSRGILTAVGGDTSHAAIVAKGKGIPCVAGCGALHIPEKNAETSGARILDAKGREHLVNENDWVTIDGTTGEVHLAELKIKPGEPTPEFMAMLAWARERKRIGVWANGDTVEDVEKALQFGAEGIGLCRTEHMFFGPEADRILHFQEMIMAETLEHRRVVLADLRVFQETDFRGIFRAMMGMPVTVRLLDPPLHEFAPNDAEAEQKLADFLSQKMSGKKDKKTREDIQARFRSLHESNPMMGVRGARLLLRYPEIVDMQIEAIVRAAARVREEGIPVQPKIMIPLIDKPCQLRLLREGAENWWMGIDAKIAQVLDQEGLTPDHVPVKVGTMIEIPAAALGAGEIAKIADFFSFGTNDLTQYALGYSRDDIGAHTAHEILLEVASDDPFVTLCAPVKELIRIGVERGRKANPDLEIGICGEHGGEARSVEFCEQAGLNYVSPSTYRVGTAVVALAQTAIR